MINRYKEYTNREIEQIAEFRAKGKCFKSIARIMDRPWQGLAKTYRRKIKELK